MCCLRKIKLVFKDRSKPKGLEAIFKNSLEEKGIENASQLRGYYNI